MPECPEAYSIAKQLRILKGERLVGSTIDDKRILGKTLRKVYSMGKKVIMVFKRASLMISLSRNGYLLFGDNSKMKNIKHVFEWNDDSTLSFVDYSFGGIEVLDDEPDWKESWGHHVEYKTFSGKLKGSGKCLANWLVEQSIIAGIGMYLRSDILYASKLHPRRKASDLHKEERRRLYDTCVEIIGESKSLGGTYYLPDGTRGKYKYLAYKNKNVEQLRIGKITIYYSSEAEEP